MSIVDTVNIVRARDNIKSASMIDVLLQQSTTDLVSNVKTKIVPFPLNGEIWPLTINDAEYHNALIAL